MPTRQTRIGSEAMKVLVCASARPEIVMKCIEELSSSQAEITVAAPCNVAAGLNEFTAIRRVSMVTLKEAGFSAGQDLTSLQGISFDTAVIVSGGLGFAGFQNVVQAIVGLRFRQLTFYNQIGRKMTIQISAGFSRALERTAVLFMRTLFRIVRPVQLFAERIYIQCAESLGL